MKRTITLAFLITAAILMQLFLTGCKQEKPEFQLEGKNGTTCANITMARGAFAYRNGFIYMELAGKVCEYDIETGKTTQIPLLETGIVSSIMVTQDHIAYYDNVAGLIAVTKDGKYSEKVYDIPGGSLYIEGTTAYYIDENRNLFRRDLSNNEDTGTMIVENVNSYHVSEDHIYAVCQKGENYIAVFSEKETILLQQIPLSFEPKLILSYGEDLYITEYVSSEQTMQVVQLSNGVENRLPIYAYSYQILGEHVIYVDEKTPGTGYKRVESYNLETGEKNILCEDVSDFGILDNRYIIFCQHEHITSTHWSYLDWKTGEMHERFYADWDNN